MRRLLLAGLVLAGAALPLPTAASAAILVADQDAFGGSGGLIRVDPVTGARTTLSENTSPPGGPGFVNPSDVVLDGNGDILVVDTSLPRGGRRGDPCQSCDGRADDGVRELEPFGRPQLR
jgi:hypothetical protein